MAVTSVEQGTERGAEFRERAFQRLGLGPRTRDELSFTSRQDQSDASIGRLENWNIEHAPQDYWHAGVEKGERLFREIAALWVHDEVAAFNALRFALGSSKWSPGWGEEAGFSDAFARAAIVGLRAIVGGQEPFWPDLAAGLDQLEEGLSGDLTGGHA